MYDGRDFTELTMTSKKQWTDNELAHFHKSFQQILPYLNAEGGTIYREIIEEMKNRHSFNQNNTSWDHDSTF